MNFAAFRPLVLMALREDLGDAGDVTSSAIYEGETAGLSLISKEEGVLAGAEMFALVFQEVDPSVEIDFYLKDGDELHNGLKVASLKGRADSLLKGERGALNFLSFLSGIATETRKYTREIEGRGSAVILDTRKTLPGYRELSKYAVRMGGGKNHRMGLYDMVLLKDNHIDICGSLADSVKRVRDKWGDKFKIEVECRTLFEVRDAINSGVDIIMLDNMNPSTILDAVRDVKGGAELEISGNVDLKNLAELADTGVDFISVGRITHSAPGFDFSLKYESVIKPSDK